MTDARIALLADRGAVAVTGTDAVKFLNGLATNELSHLQLGEAAHAGLLSPQGKILFDFLALRTAHGFLLDAQAGKTGDLVKRLSLYKLRADVAISDISAQFFALALWGRDAISSGETAGTLSFGDPRDAALGRRILAERAFAEDIASATNGTNVLAQAYHAHRIALGVPEGGKDYDFGDAYPHEADFDLYGGVSFKKGCYVGQEVVSRMQHKTVVRKRVVRITGEDSLTSGADVSHNDVLIGRVGSVAGRNALAMLRLDRYAEAITAAEDVISVSIPIRVHDADMARYMASMAAKAKG